MSKFEGISNNIAASIHEAVTFGRNCSSHEVMDQRLKIQDFKQNIGRKFSKDRSSNITRICLTGGSCAGKTTAMAGLSQDLSQLGLKVLMVPEAATLLMKGGAMTCLDGLTVCDGVEFQKILLRLQIALEDTFTELALQLSKNSDVVILCDRGLMDGSAFLSSIQWEAVLNDMGLNTMQLKDNRYEGVIHLVTAADGA